MLTPLPQSAIAGSDDGRRNALRCSIGMGLLSAHVTVCSLGRHCGVNVGLKSLSKLESCMMQIWFNLSRDNSGRCTSGIQPADESAEFRLLSVASNLLVPAARVRQPRLAAGIQFTGPGKLPLNSLTARPGPSLMVYRHFRHELPPGR